MNEAKNPRKLPRRRDKYQPFGGDVDDEEDLPLVRVQAHLLAVAILLPKFPPNKLEKKKNDAGWRDSARR